MLPDKRTLHSNGCGKFTLDSFFSTSGAYSHAIILNKLSHCISSKINDMAIIDEIDKLNMMPLNSDEIKIQFANFYSSKENLFGHAINNTNELANSIQVFQLRTLTGKKIITK